MKKEALGKLSIELNKKENNIYTLEMISTLSDGQIGILTEILCQGHKGQHGEVFLNLVEETIDTLAKILYVYDKKIKGEWEKIKND